MKKIKIALAAIVLSAFTMNAQQDSDVAAAKKAKAETTQEANVKTTPNSDTKEATVNATTPKARRSAVKQEAKRELSADEKAAKKMEKAKAKVDN